MQINDMASSDVEIEDESETNDEEIAQNISYSITSYGVDYPVDGLVQRIQSGDIVVPNFQRKFVWKASQASRFVESLLLGLPVPGIFLSRESSSRKLLVIDGQQRLITLKQFYENKHADGSDFVLKGVQDSFNNRTFSKLNDDDRRRLNDSIIHATIIQQDSPSEDDSSIYHIFERLNTGGTLLHPQEIRSSVNQGPLATLLEQLNENKNWRSIFGPLNSRMRDRELILRFFALYYDGDNYKAPMNEFLNRFMSKNKNILMDTSRDFENLFSSTIEFIHSTIGASAFKPRSNKLNAAVFDSVMVATAKRLQKGEPPSSTEFLEAYTNLLENSEFSIATKNATAGTNSVTERISIAVKTLGTN